MLRTQGLVTRQLCLGFGGGAVELTLAVGPCRIVNPNASSDKKSGENI